MKRSNDNNKNHEVSFAVNETPADKLFFQLLYICLGFLTTAIGVFGRSAFQIPFFVICFFICLRLFMRSDCHSRMSKFLQSFEFRAVAALALVVLIYSLIAISSDGNQVRLLRKPITLLLGVTLLTFIWSHKDLLDTQRIFRGLLCGVIGGLAGVAFISLWQWFVMSTSTGGDFSNALPIRVYALNDELKILSILLFLTVAGLATRLNRIVLSACLAIAVLALSFYTLGTDGNKAGTSTIIHAPSEAVQFGLPIAMIVLFLAALAPKIMTHAVFAGAAGVMVTAPWIFQLWYHLAVSLDLPRAKKFLVRAEIWDAASRTALAKPIFGHGLDAARAPGLLKFEQKYYTSSEIWHPHNMFVQVFLDMGVFGIAFALALCFLAWRGVCKIPMNLRPPVLAGIVMYLMFALTTHSVWQTWSMILLLMVCALGSLLTQKNLKT